MVNEPNTIYEVRYDFDLNGSTINVPENSIFNFKGGSISNGTINGENTTISGDRYGKLFDTNISLVGTFKNTELYPNWFGINNDNSDVTNEFRKLLNNCINIGANIFINLHDKYYITDSINYIDGEYKDCNISIIGELNTKKFVYNNNEFGGILLGDNCYLFKDCSFNGYIANIGIFGKNRVLTNGVFYNCTISSSYIYNSTFANLGSFFCDTTLSGTSKIFSNLMLTVYYFAKYDKKGTQCVDSFIYNNYINGGEKENNNACFQWMHWNGSIVSNNFIDYYRTIYEPTHNASFSCQLPLSSHNQYQVFRYLYMKRKEVQISNLSFTSVGDVINWTDVNKLQKLADYEPLTVTLGNNQGEKELPPAVCTQVAQTDTVTFDNLYLQANNCCPLVLYKSITLYDNFLLKFHCSKFNVNFNDVYPFTNCIYSNGIYKSNEIDIEGLVIKQDELPKSFNGWGNYLAGTKIVKDNIEWIYKYIINGSSAEYQWVDNRLNMDSSISSNYDAVTINSDNFTYALNNLDGVRFYTTSDKNITLTIDENYRYKTFVIYNYSNYNITFRAYHNSASITDFTLKPHNSCIVRWKFNAAKIEVINTDNLKYVYSTQPTAINPNEILVIIDLGIICYTNASGDIIASNNMSVCRRYGTTAQRPTTDILGKALIIGTQYFDSTLNKPIWWDGSKWVDATGIDV